MHVHLCWGNRWLFPTLNCHQQSCPLCIIWRLVLSLGRRKLWTQAVFTWWGLDFVQGLLKGGQPSSPVVSWITVCLMLLKLRHANSRAVCRRQAKLKFSVSQDSTLPLSGVPLQLPPSGGRHPKWTHVCVWNTCLNCFHSFCIKKGMGIHSVSKCYITPHIALFERSYEREKSFTLFRCVSCRQTATQVDLPSFSHLLCFTFL